MAHASDGCPTSQCAFDAHENFPCSSLQFAACATAFTGCAWGVCSVGRFPVVWDRRPELGSKGCSAFWPEVGQQGSDLDEYWCFRREVRRESRSGGSWANLADQTASAPLKGDVRPKYRTTLAASLDARTHDSLIDLQQRTPEADEPKAFISVLLQPPQMISSTPHCWASRFAWRHALQQSMSNGPCRWVRLGCSSLQHVDCGDRLWRPRSLINKTFERTWALQAQSWKICVLFGAGCGRVADFWRSRLDPTDRVGTSEVSSATRIGAGKAEESSKPGP